MSFHFRDYAEQASNWGRWGANDYYGALNLITPEKIAASHASVAQGIVIPLALDLNSQGPQQFTSNRQNLLHIMTRTGKTEPLQGGFQYMDDIVMLHTQASTQLDGLSHVAYDGFLYNGFPAESVTDAGAAHLGIEHLRGGIHGRGVLLDLPKYFGAKRLIDSYCITPEDLKGCLDAQGVTLEPGDIVVVRTGWIQTFLEEHDREKYLSSEPGLGIPAALWLKEQDVAMVCSDNWAIEIVAHLYAEEVMPVHCLVIRDAGMLFGEMLNLEGLSRHCSQSQRWEFLFACQVLPISGGIGAPISPVAVF